ncbi:MAG: hypothetical protein KC910_15030 [Candidatus Eremiobacteraeota bacterium]|nr:hypothetical protein [Candidatus Eremiobacteraeota bacterium]
MFQVGMKVVHSLHGLGIVEALEEKTILGSVTRMASLSFQDGRLQMMVNVSSSNSLIRPVIDCREVEAVMDTLRRNRTDIPRRANERYPINLAKIKSGNVHQLCEVVKELTVVKKITPKEHTMLKQARRILSDELACVTGCDADEMEKIVDHTCRVNAGELVLV